MDNRIFLEKMAYQMLKKLFKCLDTNQYTISKRRKNREFLALYGFTLDDQLAILRSLTPSDCIKVESDRDDQSGNDEYWFHKKSYDGISVYVKYKITIIIQPEGNFDYAIIKSIHEDGF